MYPDDVPSDPGPKRGRLVAIFGGLAVLGLAIGVAAAQIVAAGRDNSKLLGATSVASAPGEPLTASEEPADPETTAEPTPTATPEPNYRSIPENPLTQPGLDFGFLTKVTRTDGTVTLRFDRASFYTGAEAARRNQGMVPDNDYLIENTNPALRSFELDPKASIIAANRLRNQADQVSREALTLNEFVTNAGKALDTGPAQLPVWLRHTDGLTGPVTALAEQFLP
jgi:hypothetical protein